MVAPWSVLGTPERWGSLHPKEPSLSVSPEPLTLSPQEQVTTVKTRACFRAPCSADGRHSGSFGIKLGNQLRSSGSGDSLRRTLAATFSVPVPAVPETNTGSHLDRRRSLETS